MTIVRVAGRLLRALGLLALLIGGLPTHAAAQSRAGLIDGVVRHDDGRLLGGVRVVAIDEHGAQRAAATPDARGYFLLPDLAPGCYVVRLDDAGSFAPLQRVVPLGIRQSIGIDLRVGVLHLRAVQPVTVRSDAAPPTLGSARGATFQQTIIADATLARGRTIQAFFELVPGIVFTDSVGTLAQFTATGQRRFANRMTIDGVSADLAVDVTGPGLGRASGGTLPASGTSGGTQTLVPLAAVDEIKVRTTGAVPAFARAPGAQTAIVTRSGVDKLTGDLFADLRPNALAAKTSFGNAGKEPQRDLHAWTTGASLGGALLRDRLFAFAAFERQHLDRPQYAGMRVPTTELRATSDLLASYPTPTGPATAGGLADFSGRFRAASDLVTGSARLDGVLSPRRRGFLRIQRGSSGGDELGPYLLTGRAFTQREATDTTSMTAGWTQTGTRTLHEVRANVTAHQGAIAASASEFGRAFDRRPFIGDSDAWLSITLHADPAGGGIITNGAYTASRQRHLEVSNTWTAAIGRHTIQAGMELRRTLATSSPPLDTVSLRYPTLTAFTSGVSPLAIIDRHLPVAAAREGAAAYLQDTWRASPRATLSFGLRYTVTPAPRSTNGLQPSLMAYNALPAMKPLPAGSRLWKTAWGNVAPQVGLSVVLSPTTTARTGWSRAYDDSVGAGMMPYGRGYPYSSRRGVVSATLPIALDTTTAPYAPDMLAEHYAYTNDFRPAHTDQWHVGIDRQIGASHSVSLMYVGARGLDLPYWHAYYPLAPRQTTSVQAFSADGRSEYHALMAEFVRRLSKGLQARAAYTWGHSIDNDSGESTRPLLPPTVASPRSNIGNSDYDRRHNLRAIVSLEAPRSPLAAGWLAGTRLDLIATVISGSQFSVVEDRAFPEGVYLVRLDAVDGVPIWQADSAAPGGRRVNRAAFVSLPEPRQGTHGRNQLRGPGVGQIDVALSRTLRFENRATLTVRVSAYNLLNSASFGTPVGVYGEPLFGVPRQTYADALGTGTLTHGGLPSLQQIGGPRSIQGAIRLAF